MQDSLTANPPKMLPPSNRSQAKRQNSRCIGPSSSAQYLRLALRSAGPICLVRSSPTFGWGYYGHDHGTYIYIYRNVYMNIPCYMYHIIYIIMYTMQLYNQQWIGIFSGDITWEDHLEMEISWQWEYHVIYHDISPAWFRHTQIFLLTPYSANSPSKTISLATGKRNASSFVLSPYFYWCSVVLSC